MNVEIIGLIAAALTTVAFSPQVIKSWRTKSTEDISFPMTSLLFCGLFLWFIYGLMIKDLPLILANSVSSTLAFLLLVAKIRYG